MFSNTGAFSSFLNASSTLSCPATSRGFSLFICMSSHLAGIISTIIRMIENVTVVNSGKPTIQLTSVQIICQAPIMAASNMLELVMLVPASY